ncbi:pecanex-like protein 1 [Salvia splendens]|nr:pecanex-like protein 1 [Salvia splendens]
MKTRGVSSTPKSRSSSISGKTGAGRAVASAKSDGRLKGTREAGKQHLYARAVGTLKKSASVASKSKKAETATALRKKDSSDHEESPIVGDEEDAGMPDQELDSSNEQTQGEIDDTVSEQSDASIGEAVSPAICEESDDNVPKHESPTLLGQDDADAVNDADAGKAESPVSSEQRVECPADSEQASGNSSQQKEVEVVAEDGEAAPRLSQEKKDTALSNNVTEEMKREQRRDKFRALAGAFETAIARQEHK